MIEIHLLHYNALPCHAIVLILVPAPAVFVPHCISFLKLVIKLRTGIKHMPRLCSVIKAFPGSPGQSFCNRTFDSISSSNRSRLHGHSLSQSILKSGYSWLRSCLSLSWSRSCCTRGHCVLDRRPCRAMECDIGSPKAGTRSTTLPAFQSRLLEG